jgi:hypothetical protein
MPETTEKDPIICTVGLTARDDLILATLMAYWTADVSGDMAMLQHASRELCELTVSGEVRKLAKKLALAANPDLGPIIKKIDKLLGL